ncbi:MAG: hypothetical protein ACRCVN_02745 [Spirochaetia bacterium]
MAKLVRYTFLVPFFLIIGIFFFLPLSYMFLISLKDPQTGQLGLANYIEILTDSYYYSTFLVSLKIAFVTSPLALLFGVILSYTIFHHTKRQNTLLNMCNLLKIFAGIPLVLGYVIAFGFNGALSVPLRKIFPIENYDIYTPVGYMFISLWFMIPNATIFSYPIWGTIDKHWKRAAAILGANNIIYFIKILFPLLSSRFFSVFVILIADSITTYATAYALSTGALNIVTLKIASMISGDLFLEVEKASAMAIVMSLFLLFLIFLRSAISKKMKLGRDYEV